MIEMRPVRPEDREALRSWRNLPEVARYMYSDHQISAEEHALWFERIMRDESCRYWIISCDGEDVGVANVTRIDEENSRCEWAFYLASPNVRGKGVGSFVEHFVLRYVFEELGLNKLCCEVLSFNEAVVAMHESFGFKKEGVLRQHRKKGGAFHDVVQLSMLRAEWMAIRPLIERRLQDKGLLPKSGG